MSNVDFEAVRRHWDEHAQGEEAWAQKPSANRQLRMREIERHLAGVRTILDVGGATGAFSIPLAQRGFQVTHLDISPAMLEIARAKAAGLANITFLNGNAAILPFFDGSFDLVLNMDGPISGSGDAAEQVVRESARVTAGTLIVSAAHEAWATVARRRDGKKLDDLRTFTAGGLRDLLRQAGLSVLRASGVGTLAHLCGKAYVDELLASGDSARIAAFLDECERFDRELAPDGPGSNDDTGLIAVARRMG